MRCLASLCLGCLLLATGCSSLGLGSITASAPDWLTTNPFDKTAKASRDAAEDEDDEKDPTALVGEYVTISGMNPIVLEGVGLVTGLRNTGGDLPPSNHRRMILEDMKKRRVPNPNAILQSPTTAVVNVRVYVPPLVEKGDRLDVEVSLPEGSEATSLRGGMLLECALYETGFVPGRGTMKGDELADATGRVLITAANEEGNEDHLAGVLRRGVIPGGGRYTGEPQHLGLTLKTKYRSVKMSKRVADKIGFRFHDLNEYNNRRPLATAKTDSRIVLDIPRNYRDNFARYLQVVRKVPVRESQIERRIRLERLRAELQDPATAGNASLELEAIGREAIPMLRDGLEAENEQCRFHAAAALAYLGEDHGVELLREAAENDRTARVWALLAMASMQGGEAIHELTKLLDDDNIETRYGALRAITTVDERHPDVRPEVLGDKTSWFLLRPIQKRNPAALPAVHVTKRKKAEVCVFDDEQEFRTPMFVRAGHRILVVGRAGADTITITKVDRPDQEPETRTVSRQVDSVIRACAELGATYPDIVGLLMEADRQHNLPGQLAIDALPQTNRRFSSAPKSSSQDEDSRDEDSWDADESFDDDVTDEPTSEPVPEEIEEPAAAPNEATKPALPKESTMKEQFAVKQGTIRQASFTAGDERPLDVEQSEP